MSIFEPEKLRTQVRTDQPRRHSQPHSAELTREASGGKARAGSGRHVGCKGPGALFTLRESRRGRLETGGWEVEIGGALEDEDKHLEAGH